ncbi:hypothetical protein E3983_04845 [Legionella israelensis]|uniref:Uncharacterized protein n=1 Tax=Legionella israelensis TaxID=454 RepID=A0AAX1EF67_9GAMM|nr:hypothetical protein [Legionella israelensis]QBR83741.1 hypothetical protein E3983_04845 [Legionella israelensis]
MKISVSQALLILLDKYKKDKARFKELKSLYLSGAKDEKSLKLINEYLNDDILQKYEVSREPEVINEDSSRRYFETHLAYETLSRKIDGFTAEEIKTYTQWIKELVPDYYNQLWDRVVIEHKGKADNIEREYSDFFNKLKNHEIFTDFSEENRGKIVNIVAAAFIAMVIASNKPDALPLDIYGEGIYLERGKKDKSGQKSTATSAYGLLRGHSPLPRDDKALMAKPQRFLKPSDQATYDLQAQWVKDNFDRLVHPFSNSISGTMLCQLRALLKIRENLKALDSNFQLENPEQLIPLSPEKLETFMTTFISVMLFNSGGHTLYEYAAPLELDKVQEAFSDVEGFNQLNLEELFLTSNEEAFDVALNKAIDYNNQLLLKSDIHQEIQEKKTAFDLKTLKAAIEESPFSSNVKENFNQLLNGSDVDKVKMCFIQAEKLNDIIQKNEERVSSELFSSYRQGSARHKIVTKNLNEAIDALSHGEVTQAKTLIEQTISQLDQYQSRFFQTKMPERAILQEVYGNIDRSITDKRSQMEV